VHSTGDWLSAHSPEPGHTHANDTTQPGSQETQESSVSAGPGRRERTSCIRAESSGARPAHTSRQPISVSVRPCCIRAGNQTGGRLHGSSRAKEGLAHGCDAGYRERPTNRPLISANKNIYFRDIIVKKTKYLMNRKHVR